MIVTAWIPDGESRIYMRTDYSLRETCKALPGARWDPSEKAWHVPATPAAAAAMRRAFQTFGLRVDGPVSELLATAKQQDEARRMRVATDLEDIPARPPEGGETWLHQRQAFHFAKELDASMLAMGMGTGKSLTAIALLEEWNARKVLILCPKSVVGVWPKQFGLHAQTMRLIITPNMRQPVPKRLLYIERQMRMQPAEDHGFVVILNYEAAWRDGMDQLLKSVDWDCVILDESHRVKSSGGRASRYVSLLRDRAKRRLCLTGTPMPHSPLDIYAQYRFLDPGIFGTSKNRFQNRYAIMGGFEGRQVIGWQNQEEMTEKLGSIAFFVSSEVLDLIPPLHTEREFDLDVKALRIYKQLEQDFIAGIDEGIVTASNALTKLLRLRQITSGHTKTEDEKIVQLSDAREKLLADVLADLPKHEPVVVFAAFHPDLDAIRRVAESQGRTYGELSGRRRDGLTEDATMAAFDVVGVQLQSGGVGIDLTRAHYAIYYSVDFNLGNYEQSLKRLDRPGQDKRVDYIHLIAKGTVDETVYKALQARKNVVEAVIEAAKGGS